MILLDSNLFKILISYNNPEIFSQKHLIFCKMVDRDWTLDSDLSRVTTCYCSLIGWKLSDMGWTLTIVWENQFYNAVAKRWNVILFTNCCLHLILSAQTCPTRNKNLCNSFCSFLLCHARSCKYSISWQLLFESTFKF